MVETQRGANDQEIQRQLATEVARYWRLARWNSGGVRLLYFVALLSSIAATIWALMGGSGVELAVLTAAPGLLITFDSTFKFNEKSYWHYDKRRQLESLRRRHQAGTLSTSDTVEQWNKIDEEMDLKWPRMGPFPGSTGKE
jgi:hypothetical protein